MERLMASLLSRRMILHRLSVYDKALAVFPVSFRRRIRFVHPSHSRHTHSMHMNMWGKAYMEGEAMHMHFPTC